MMLRRLGGWALLLLVLIVATGAGYVWFESQTRIERLWPIDAAGLAIPDDPAALERGEHLAVTRGCTFCHAADLGGQVLTDDGFMGRIVAGNLTTDPGSALLRYDDAGLARAIRHGVGSNDRSLVVMPSESYHALSDADVGALIAYLRSVPPVERALPVTQVGLGARMLIALNKAPLLTAEIVDHEAVRTPEPPEAVSAEYGAYVASMCVGCHGPDYSGGLVHGPPGTPPSIDLRPGGPLSGWDEEQFLMALRHGRRPDGSIMDPSVMPWPAFTTLTDTEARAIWAFLKTLPAAP